MILVSQLVLTGCWDRVEVDKLAIVVGLGVDRVPGPNPILLTAQIINPSAFQQQQGGGGGGKPFFVATAKGKSVYEAIRNFSKGSPRKMFFSQNNVILIGGAMARSGVQNLVDYFERDPKFRRTNWMMVTPGNAGQILSTKLDLQKLSAIGFTEILRQVEQSEAVRLTQRMGFMSHLLSKSQSTYASEIVMDGQHNLQIAGIGLFRKDKLVGYYNDAELRGMMWLTGQLRGGAVVRPCPDNKANHIVFRVNETHYKIKPSHQYEQLNMDIEIGAEETVIESNCPKLDLSKPQTIRHLDKMGSDEIKKRVLHTIHKAQALKTDVFGFAGAFYRNDPAFFESLNKERPWEETFPHVNISVHVTSHIRHVGMIGNQIYHK